MNLPYTFLGLQEMATAYPEFRKAFLTEALRQELFIAVNPKNKLSTHPVIHISARESDLTHVKPEHAVILKTKGSDLLADLQKLNEGNIRVWGMEKCLRLTPKELKKILGAEHTQPRQRISKKKTRLKA